MGFIRKCLLFAVLLQLLGWSEAVGLAPVNEALSSSLSTDAVTTDEAIATAAAAAAATLVHHPFVQNFAQKCIVATKNLLKAALTSVVSSCNAKSSCNADSDDFSKIPPELLFPPLKGRSDLNSVTFLVQAPDEYMLFGRTDVTTSATFGDVRPSFLILEKIVRNGYSGIYFAPAAKYAAQNQSGWLSYLEDVGFSKIRDGVVPVGMPLNSAAHGWQDSCGLSSAQQEEVRSKGVAMVYRVTDFSYGNKILRLIWDQTDWKIAVRGKMCCAKNRGCDEKLEDEQADGLFLKRDEMVAASLADPQAAGADLVSLLGLSSPGLSTNSSADEGAGAGVITTARTHHCLGAKPFFGPAWFFDLNGDDQGLGVCGSRNGQGEGSFTAFNYGDQWGRNRFYPDAVTAATAELLPEKAKRQEEGEKKFPQGPNGSIVGAVLPGADWMQEDRLETLKKNSGETTVCAAFSLSWGANEENAWKQAFASLQSSPPKGFRLENVDAVHVLPEKAYRDYVCDVVYTTGGMASVAGVLQFGALPVQMMVLWSLEDLDIFSLPSAYVSCLEFHGSGMDKQDIRNSLQNPDWSLWGLKDKVSEGTALTPAVGCAPLSAEVLIKIRDEKAARDAAKQVSRVLRNGQEAAATIVIQRATATATKTGSSP